VTTRPNVSCMRGWQSCEVIEVDMEVRDGDRGTRLCYWPWPSHLLDSKLVLLICSLLVCIHSMRVAIEMHGSRAQRLCVYFSTA